LRAASDTVGRRAAGLFSGNARSGIHMRIRVGGTWIAKATKSANTQDAASRRRAGEGATPDEWAPAC
jgi:hypothetical protein